MRKILLAMALCTTIGTSAQVERDRLFNDGWKFWLGNVDGAERAAYNDKEWRNVDLPHDWSIEALPNQINDSIIGPFDKGAIGEFNVGYVRGGTGWYRKTFRLSASDKGKVVGIHFDGVFMNTTVWLNGHRVGEYHHGYVPFWFDLTPYLKPTGQDNVIAVKVENEGITGRWYSGSGIYRDVWLSVKEQQHIATWGVKVTTPEVTRQSAQVVIETTIDNEASQETQLNVVTFILDANHRKVAEAKGEIGVKAKESASLTLQTKVEDPYLWSVDSPTLYQAITEIWDKGTLKDKTATTFGIRCISYSADKGFLLNGERIILKGGCVHHDHGLIGAASYRQAEEREIRLLKQNGYNGIRTSHNPASSHLLDACDRLGMLVITEAFDVWTVEKMGNPQDYHLHFSNCWEQDVENFVKRDRNHPSIIMWSIGNEIPERVQTEGVEITKKLVSKFRQLDNTRPLTEAFCRYQEKINAGMSWEATAEPMSHLDIVGYNYVGDRYYKKDHQKYPERLMYGSEIYPNKSLSSYKMALENPYILGDFVWTAIDYMGEVAIGRREISSKKGMATIFRWPWYNAFCGDIDLIGNRKPQSYYRNVVWGNLHIAMAVHVPMEEGMFENLSQWGWPDERRSWTWNGYEGKAMDVRVYSRAPLVRLYLNEQLVGEKQVEEGNIQADFKVPYQKGELIAVNVENGKETDACILATTYEAEHIKLIAEQEAVKAGRGEIVYVMVKLTDRQGYTDVNMNDTELTFKVSGEAEILGVGNANPAKPMDFQSRRCKTYQGRCLVVLRSTGKRGTAVLTASGNGLSTGEVKVKFD